jgi:hypothetical protein
LRTRHEKAFHHPRREFLAALGATALPLPLRAAIENTEPMKITQIDAVTFRKDLKIGGGSGGSYGTEFRWGAPPYG